MFSVRDEKAHQVFIKVREDGKVTQLNPAPKHALGYTIHDIVPNILLRFVLTLPTTQVWDAAIRLLCMLKNISMPDAVDITIIDPEDCDFTPNIYRYAQKRNSPCERNPYESANQMVDSSECCFSWADKTSSL